MENFFRIGEAAKLAGTTAETLRHYDRTGLASPSHTDKWTGYRYYSQSDIVRISTIKALQSMDFSLKEIKEILQADDIAGVLELLNAALVRADKKIAELESARRKIERAKAHYENKLSVPTGGAYERTLPQRTILLLQSFDMPTVENLTDYHRHFYRQLKDEMKGKFTFEDAAGIYTRGGEAHMFAICKTFVPTEGLEVLPAGRYLCRRCGEAERTAAEAELAQRARKIAGAPPQFAVSMVALTGILKWEYEVQIFIE